MLCVFKHCDSFSRHMWCVFFNIATVLADTCAVCVFNIATVLTDTCSRCTYYLTEAEVDFLNHYRLVDPKQIDIYAKPFVVEDDDKDGVIYARVCTRALLLLIILMKKYRIRFSVCNCTCAQLDRKKIIIYFLGSERSPGRNPCHSRYIEETDGICYKCRFWNIQYL